MEFVTTGQRGRGAAARGQPDQALPADVQHRPARRQELPLHLSAHGHEFPLIGKHRGAKRAGHRVFRPLRLGRCGQRHAQRAAQGVPAAHLPRQHLQRPAPGPACSTRSSAARRPASAGSARRTTAGSSTRCASSCPAGRTRSRPGCRPRCGEASAQPRVRARGRPARPPEGDGAHPGAPGHQHRRGRRRRRDRGPRTRAGRSACRCSSTAAGATTATAPTIRRTPRMPSRPRSLAAFLAQFYAERPPPPADAAGRADAGAGAAGRGAGRARRPQGRARWSRSAASKRQLVETALDQRPPGPGPPAGRHGAAGAAARAAGRAVRAAGHAGSGSRSTTTATSRAPTRSAPSSSPAPRASTSRSYRTFNIKGARPHAGRRLRDDARGAAAPLRPPGQGGPGAGRAAGWPDLVVIDGGAGQLAAAQETRGRARPRRPAAAGGRQGPRPRRRPGAVLPAGPRAAGAGPARPGPLLCAAAARRGAPLRHPDPSRQAGARHRPLGARPGARHRRQAQAGAARTISARPRAWREAGLLDLERVPGINRAVAKAIYDYFHDGG